MGCCPEFAFVTCSYVTGYSVMPRGEEGRRLLCCVLLCRDSSPGANPWSKGDLPELREIIGFLFIASAPTVGPHQLSRVPPKS